MELKKGDRVMIKHTSAYIKLAGKVAYVLGKFQSQMGIPGDAYLIDVSVSHGQLILPAEDLVYMPVKGDRIKIVGKMTRHSGLEAIVLEGATVCNYISNVNFSVKVDVQRKESWPILYDKRNCDYSIDPDKRYTEAEVLELLVKFDTHVRGKYRDSVDNKTLQNKRLLTWLKGENNG